MKKKWPLWLCAILAILLFLNYETETVPFHYSKKPSNHSDFSVLCYNVKCSDKDYQRNQIDIAKEIISEAPDVVFLCEFNRSVSKSLNAMMTKMGGYECFYRPGANCIFYSKYDIDSLAGIDTGTSKGKKALNNMVHVMTPHGVVTIFGCHLSSSRKDLIGGFRNRVAEADSINKAVFNETSPIIVMGDLNDVSGSYTLNRIKDIELADAWWEGGCGYGTTFHNKWLSLRLDHILYPKDKLNLESVKVIASDLSDHNALIAYFSFK